MLVLAIICGAAGTWQIARFHEKRDANHKLRADNRDQPLDVAAVLGNADAPISTGSAQKYRHVTATGSYLGGQQTVLRNQSVGGDVGYLVITPLRTGSGVLLVARGFVKQTGAAATTPPIPASPPGTVTVTARLQPADATPDRFGRLPGRQIETVNPAQQAARIGAPVWKGYAELLAGQPGTAGLTALPDPDMSNPAGGAEEPQHAAYVVQWYLFGALALCAPFVMAAAERRRDEDEAADEEASAGGPPDHDPEPARGRAAAKSRKASLDDRLAGRA